MAGYDINVGRDLLPGLLSGQNGLAKLVETVLNQILEAQVAGGLGSRSARAFRRAAGLPQRLSCAHALHSRWPGHPASTSDA